MKPVHEKVNKEALIPGNTYTLGLNGKQLYSAEVVKFFGGCWATVRVVAPLNEETRSAYTPGMEFDIKVAQYEISDSAE